MSVTQTAKSGLKTFVLTFSVSVLVFGALYYMFTDVSTSNISIEDSTPISSATGTTQVTPAVPATPAEPVAVLGDEDEAMPSVFGALAAKPVDAESRAVLAEADQTTQSTVPETGVFGVTVAFILSISLLAVFAFIVFNNPRKYALNRFEKKMSN